MRCIAAHLLKDAERLEDPATNLTKSFVDELNRHFDTLIYSVNSKTKRRKRILLFFDTFEQLAVEAVPWLIDHFLQADINNNIVLIFAGRDTIDHSVPEYVKQWLPYYDEHVIYSIALSSFTKDEVKAYLAEKGITDSNKLNIIWQISRGLPLFLSLLTTNQDRDIDPTEDVVDNFLRWIPEAEKVKRRLALDAALLSKPFNQDDIEVFTYLPKDENERTNLFNWLIGLPFIKSNFQEGLYEYHNLVQDLFCRYLYKRSQKEFFI